LILSRKRYIFSNRLRNGTVRFDESFRRQQVRHQIYSN
jgi:hypothetical protein